MDSSSQYEYMRCRVAAVGFLDVSFVDVRLTGRPRLRTDFRRFLKAVNRMTAHSLGL